MPDITYTVEHSQPEDFRLTVGELQVLMNNRIEIETSSRAGSTDYTSESYRLKLIVDGPSGQGPSAHDVTVANRMVKKGYLRFPSSAGPNYRVEYQVGHDLKNILGQIVVQVVHSGRAGGRPTERWAIDFFSHDSLQTWQTARAHGCRMQSNGWVSDPDGELITGKSELQDGWGQEKEDN